MAFLDVRRGMRKLVSGAFGELRAGAFSELVTQDGHPRYQEQTLLGNSYSLSTALAGVTVAAANVVTAATSAQPLIGISNPAGSGVNAVIWLLEHIWNSGTPGAGGLVWGYVPAGADKLNTGTASAVEINLLSKAVGTSKMRTYQNAAMTNSGAAAALKFLGGPAAFALAAGAQASWIVEPAGCLIVQPGEIGGMFAAAAGTSPIVSASFVWTEIDIVA